MSAAPAISLQRMLGYAMAPVCWLMGLPWPQAITAGSLMGVKTVLNELIAYVDLSKLGPDALDPRSRLIMLYAMCGFANFGSLGIMIGGLGTMAPQRRDEINSLGLKSIVSGTLTTCLMGAIVGVLSPRPSFRARTRGLRCPMTMPRRGRPGNARRIFARAPPHDASFDRLELRRQDHFQQFDVVGIIHDQMLDPRRLGPAAALFHQGLALPFHVGFDPALEHIDHLKFDVVEMQF